MTDPTPLPPPKRPGIQPGQVARAGAPDQVEKAVRGAHALAWPQAQAAVAPHLPAGWTLVHQRGVSAKQILQIMAGRGMALPDGFEVCGYMPDGGIYALRAPDGRLMPFLGSEAKSQKATGNAIERWHKNYTITKLLAHDMAMLTFASGKGAVPHGPICRTLNVALMEYALQRNKPLREWNRLYLQGPSMFARVEGFTAAEVAQTLGQAILGGALLHLQS